MNRYKFMMPKPPLPITYTTSGYITETTWNGGKPEVIAVMNSKSGDDDYRYKLYNALART